MVNVPLPEPIAELLSERAKAGGLSLPDYLIWLSNQAAPNGANGHHQPADWDEAFDRMIASLTEWGRNHLPPGHTVDDSRESIYE
jgi:hypothetical protein